MNPILKFAPEQASLLASQVDNLYVYLVAVSLFFTVLIFVLVTFFAVKYRRRSESERPKAIHGSIPLEITWSVIPLILAMSMFAWGSYLFFQQFRPPQNAEEIFVVGKQWMWKIQHPEGRREINELHIPVGRPVTLTMTSEDVIHSFFVPAFRTKMDVLPGKYTKQWFSPTREGKYHLFCAEYCGTDHSRMTGTVTVMSEHDYEEWLGGEKASALSMEQSGEILFKELRCDTCHHAGSGALGPRIPYGTPVNLENGQTVIADEGYIRESILEPNAKVVAGYAPVMPTYKEQVTEEQVLQLIAYIKGLNEENPEETARTPVPDEVPLRE